MTLHRDPTYAAIRLAAQLARRERAVEGDIRKRVIRIARTGIERCASAASHLVGLNRQAFWFSAEESRAAAQERDALLASLAGHLSYSAEGCKPHTGVLSPGCQICEKGGWGCNFINRLCTRDCDFCKRYHRGLTAEPDAETDGVAFSDPSEHLEYLKTFNIEGVGFSGGEPLLVPDRLLSHIRAIRQEFGSRMYLWMYTNGDLVGDSILRELRDAGLDEIRFNIAARAYDVSPVMLARKYIPTVTVEIPALPQDFETVTGLLPHLQAIGVDHLNLHQLTLEQQNYKGVLNRHHHLLIGPSGITVFESELCALKLIRDACDLGLELPINYCSHVYKNRYQSRGLRRQIAGAIVKGTEQVTEAGYIRSVEVSDAAEKIETLLSKAADAGHDPTRWNVNHDGTRAQVHTDLIPLVNSPSATLTISYLDPTPVREKRSAGLDRRRLKELHRVETSTRVSADSASGVERQLSTAMSVGTDLHDALLQQARQLDGADTRRKIEAALEFERLEQGMPDVS